MSGINAAVVGILLAAFYQLVWRSAIFTILDFDLAATAFVALIFWRAPSFSIVVFCVSSYAFMPCFVPNGTTPHSFF